MCCQTSGTHSCRSSFYVTETNNLFSQFQKVCGDPITGIVQPIEDGFQQRPMQRSVLKLLDFRRARGTVWREKLLLHMLDTVIPSIFIYWFRSFFNDRRTRVQLFNVFSPSRRFTQGPPQGSFLAPLLFLFYINNLTSSLNDDAVIALFAEHVSILITTRNKEDAKAANQSIVNSVVTWS